MLPEERISLLYHIVGTRIRERREELKISQTALARSLEISRVSLANMEQARHRPPLHLLYSVAENLRISVVELIPEDEELLPSTEGEKDQLWEKAMKRAGEDKVLAERIYHFMKENKSKSQ